MYRTFTYATDFQPNVYIGNPIDYTGTSGDGLVTVRSSIRGCKQLQISAHIKLFAVNYYLTDLSNLHYVFIYLFI